MNICILFILFHGGAYVTPACFDAQGAMYSPQDIVMVEDVPDAYYHVVYECPQAYVSHYRHHQYAHHVARYRHYRYRQLEGMERRHHMRRHRTHHRWHNYSDHRSRRYSHNTHNRYRHRSNVNSHRHRSNAHSRRHRSHNRHNVHRNNDKNTRRTPRLKKRTVRRTYNNRGNLKRRVTTRRYRRN